MAEQTDETQFSYKRVLLKISGEALMGDQGYGLHPPTVERIAAEVKRVSDLGVELCLVIGGYALLWKGMGCYGWLWVVLCGYGW